MAKDRIYTEENYPGSDFERTFVRLAIEEVVKQGYSHSELARRVFVDASCEESSAILKWRRIRHVVSGSGTPHRITLREAFVLCRILGLNISTLCFRTEQTIMQDQAAKQS